MAVGATLCTWC